MLVTHITVAAKLATLGATAKNKWMSALPILVKMGPRAQTTLEATAVRYLKNCDLFRKIHILATYS